MRVRLARRMRMRVCIRLAQFAHVVAVLFLMHKRRTAALLCFCCALLSF